MCVYGMYLIVHYKSGMNTIQKELKELVLQISNFKYDNIPGTINLKKEKLYSFHILANTMM
jgi:hypothetical protein